MNNKLTNYEANLFKRFWNKLKNIFSNEDILKEKNDNNVEKNYMNDTITIQELVNNFENGTLKEENMTKEEYEKIRNYYIEKSINLEKEIIYKKNLIKKKREKLIVYYKKAINQKEKYQ